MAFRSLLLSRSRLRKSRFLSSLLVALVVAFAAELVEAQPKDCQRFIPGHPSDYYEARGCGLLQSVEQIHLTPGQGHLRARQYEQAVADFHFVLAQFPNHPQGLISMAQACEQWKSPKCRPEGYFESALSINPNVAGTFVALGIYFHRARLYPRAIDSFKRALQLEPDSTTAHYDLGLAYVETKQYDLANEEAQAAYALGAPLPGLRNRLEAAGRWKALERKPTSEAIVIPLESLATDAPIDGVAKK